MGVALFGVLCSALFFGGTNEKASANWVFDHYEGQGTTTTHRDATVSPVGPPFDSNYPWSVSGTVAGPIGSSAKGVGAFAKITGKFRVIYRWQPPIYNPTATPPAYVTFQITASASATARAYNSSDANLPQDHGSKEVVSATAWGKSGAIVVDVAPNGYSRAGAGKTERTVAKVTGNTVASPWIESSANSEIKTGRFANPYTMGNQTYYGTIYDGDTWVYLSNNFSAPDNRAVIITSAIEPSFYKGTNSSGNPVPLTHMRAADGSLEVDTVAKWEADKNAYDTGKSIYAYPIGSWASFRKFFTWGGDATQVNDTGFDAFVGSHFVAASDLPKTYKAQVTLQETDNPDIKSKNSYTVRVHAPFENWAPYAPAISILNYPSLRIDQPGYAISGGSIRAEWNYEQAFWGETAQTVIPAVSSLFPGVWESLFNAAGVAIDQVGPKPDANSASFDACWGKAGSTYTPYRDDTKKSFYEMTPVLRIGYTTKFLRGDAYDNHGYAGIQEKVVQPFNGSREFVGDFNWAAQGDDVDPDQP